jgi:hypothetical protein
MPMLSESRLPLSPRGRSGLVIRRVRLPYPVAIGGRGGPIGGGGPGGGGGGGPGGGGGNIESCMVSSS